MVFQGGVKALIKEATDHPHFNAEFPEAINQFDSNHGKEVWTFLEHREYWTGATSTLYAENTVGASWIVPVPLTTKIICPGCEENCYMPVEKVSPAGKQYARKGVHSLRSTPRDRNDKNITGVVAAMATDARATHQMDRWFT